MDIHKIHTLINPVKPVDPSGEYFITVDKNRCEWCGYIYEPPMFKPISQDKRGGVKFIKFARLDSDHICGLYLCKKCIARFSKLLTKVVKIVPEDKPTQGTLFDL